eukprot:1146747-Pelagomonas_calceolata.AAC.1
MDQCLHMQHSALSFIPSARQIAQQLLLLLPEPPLAARHPVLAQLLYFYTPTCQAQARPGRQLTNRSKEAEGVLHNKRVPTQASNTAHAHPEIFFSTIRMRGLSSSAFIVFWSVMK